MSLFYNWVLILICRFLVRRHRIHVRLVCCGSRHIHRWYGWNRYLSRRLERDTHRASQRTCSLAVLRQRMRYAVDISSMCNSSIVLSSKRTSHTHIFKERSLRKCLVIRINSLSKRIPMGTYIFP